MMKPKNELGSGIKVEDSPVGCSTKDSIAYGGIGVYSLVNIAWIVWAFNGAGFGIFDTAGIIGILIPILGLLALVTFQFTPPHRRFSVLANVLSILTIAGWFFVVGYIVAAASAAV